jgi:hypothetical protein
MPDGDFSPTLDDEIDGELDAHQKGGEQNDERNSELKHYGRIPEYICVRDKYFLLTGTERIG